MRLNRVKRNISAGGTAIGTMVFEFDTAGIARIAAGAGADFVLFDMEHTGWSVETIRRLVATCRPDGAVPFVRVPALEYHFVARVLDMGAMGIMVPMMESAEQAEKFVQIAKYPPVGRRGAAFGIAHDDYEGGDLREKIATANSETLLIAQIETAAGLQHCEEIAAIPGIDVLWIGQFDLTNSLGIPGQFDHPLFVEGVRHVVAACEQHGKVPGFMVTDVTSGRAMLAQGFRILAYSGDLWI
ncbi:MAG: HpcH/HpaI aldolase/citrate lyase family protein [Pirellulaceae bacterium]